MASGPPASHRTEAPRAAAAETAPTAEPDQDPAPDAPNEAKTTRDDAAAAATTWLSAP